MATSNFKIETVTANEGKARLSRLRSGRGGRTSKYQPILDAVEKAPKGKIVTASGVPKNGVQALRSFVLRNLDPDEYKVKSAKQKDSDDYTVAVGRISDFE